MKEAAEVKNKYNISENLTDRIDSAIADSSAYVFSTQKGSFLHKERRNYKDSVFVDLFYTDENAEGNPVRISEAEKQGGNQYADW